MGYKPKEAIVDILKRSGPLSSASLKERVQVFLNIDEDDYPKSTYLNHLSQLIDELKIKYKTDGNKRIYFIESHSHPINGGKILDKINSRIDCHSILNNFNLELSENLKLDHHAKKFRLNFVLLGNNFLIEIDQDAVPFNLYLTRKTDEKLNLETIYKTFGMRTIILELSHQKLSSYKNEIRNGHFLLAFNQDGELKLKDLNATNPSSITLLNELEYQKVANELTKYNQTINAEWSKSISLIEKQISLNNHSEVKFHQPAIISLSHDGHILIN